MDKTKTKNNGYLAKYSKLKKRLEALSSVVVAFSGGVDSGLLAAVAVDVLGKKSIAITATSVTYPANELNQAKIIAKGMAVKHRLIHTQEFKDKNFISNTKQRCYWCKKELFSQLAKVKEHCGFSFIVDGTTHEDRKDVRPGRLAAKEFGVISPLCECGFNKDEVRQLARHLGLYFWNKPSGTCLSSRIPFGEKIALGRIKKVGRAEEIISNFLGNNAFLRVRDHNSIARIEVPKDKIFALMKKKGWPEVIGQLKKIGYCYITVDIEGYIPQGKRYKAIKPEVARY